MSEKTIKDLENVRILLYITKSTTDVIFDILNEVTKKGGNIDLIMSILNSHVKNIKEIIDKVNELISGVKNV
jgi:predicted transcriptional regulator